MALQPPTFRVLLIVTARPLFSQVYLNLLHVLLILQIADSATFRSLSYTFFFFDRLGHLSRGHLALGIAYTYLLFSLTYHIAY